MQLWSREFSLAGLIEMFFEKLRHIGYQDDAGITCARFRVLGCRVQGLGLTKMGLQRAVSVLDGDSYCGTFVSTLQQILDQSFSRSIRKSLKLGQCN